MLLLSEINTPLRATLTISSKGATSGECDETRPSSPTNRNFRGKWQLQRNLPPQICTADPIDDFDLLMKGGYRLDVLHTSIENP